MKTAKDILIIVVLLALVFGFGYFTGIKKVPDTKIQMDTVVLRDTLHDTITLVQWKKEVRIDTLYYMMPGETVHDSISIPIPIEQKTYSTDNYIASIEGYKPNLIGITVFPETKYITETKINQVRKCWGVSAGLQFGYGITPKGVTAYSGLGVTFGFSF